MLCEKCQKREATIHLTQKRNSVTTEHHLCEICARDQEIGINLHQYLDNVFGPSLLGGGSIFDTAGGIPAFGKVASQNPVCPVCKQSFDDFRRSGLFGCSHCYAAFADRLDPLLRRVQGSTRHVGRKVCQTADQQEQSLLRAKLSDLKKQLQQAVQEEAYEKAAKLRDDIHLLEKRLCSDDTAQEGQENNKGGKTP